MPKLWRNVRDARGKIIPQEVISAQPISKPTIVYISGYLTVDTDLQRIRNDIERVEKALRNQPGLSAPPQVYCWSHSGSRKMIFNIAAYSSCPKHLYCTPAQKLAEETVMPLVCKDGKPLPFADVQKNLRNLTFFGYSAGSVIAQEVFNISLQMMEKAGHKIAEARKLLKEVVLVTIGTVSRPLREHNRFTTLSLINSDDRYIRLKNTLLHPLRSAFAKASRPLSIRALSDSSLVVSAAASRKIWDRRKKSKEAGMGDVDLPRWKSSTTNHTFESYVNNNDKHSQVSGIIPYALINAVNRKTTISPYQLLEPPAALSAEEKARYQQRIKKACGLK